MTVPSIRIGTSSYIIPADIIPNVEFLKDKVDDIELVLFESHDASNIPDEKTIATLKKLAEENDLTYTVHLPYDVKAGSPNEEERLHAVKTWLKVISVTKDLPVHGFIVHLEPERYRNADGTPVRVPADDIPRWTKQVTKSMRELREGITVNPDLICVETLCYDLLPYLPEILKNGFSVALDVGHLWLNGFYSPAYVRALLPYTRIVHIHGVQGLKDHLSLEKGNQETIREFLAILKTESVNDTVLTLEIFSEQDLKESLGILRRYDMTEAKR